MLWHNTVITVLASDSSINNHNKWKPFSNYILEPHKPEENQTDQGRSNDMGIWMVLLPLELV